MVFSRLFLLFTVIPLIELFILIRLGSVIGAAWTVLLVVGTGALGAYLARHQGWFVWRDIQTELNIGRFPGEQMLDALLLLIAGVVLITPGIITDLVGFALLIPASRAPIRRFISARLRRMSDDGTITFHGPE
ncbi:MAG: FxsA family protein [Spirochaeta sp.]|nr:FxsA family protein [Spirochaeta sp.]